MAAYEEALKTINGLASGDLSTHQFKGVYIDSNGQIAVVAADGAQAIGILQDKPGAAGRACCVAVGGVSKVRAGGTVTQGQRFSFNASGLAVAVGSGDDWSMGVALETFANGGIYPALIQPAGPERSALA